ncbi:MAG: hypothetical protein C5B50_19060 [Verrucomicrobia bacterium]|nr:MAG: hypothetical protein C5B50_19060 [Verrucomicrobiota bacterium]
MLNPAMNRWAIFCRPAGLSTAWLLFGTLLLSQNLAIANPAAHPKRMIQSHAVDLTPLIRWWEEPHGPRPLMRWKHLHGTLEQEANFAWVIRGKIEGVAGPQVFVLKNPPREGPRRHKELQDSIAKMEQERAVAEQIARLPAYDGWHWEYYALVQTPTVDFHRIEQARETVADLDARIHAAREELDHMSHSQGRFKVDLFALQLNQLDNGRPVFDFGYWNWPG